MTAGDREYLLPNDLIIAIEGADASWKTLGEHTCEHAAPWAVCVTHYDRGRCAECNGQHRQARHGPDSLCDMCRSAPAVDRRLELKRGERILVASLCHGCSELTAATQRSTS